VRRRGKWWRMALVACAAWVLPIVYAVAQPVDCRNGMVCPAGNQCTADGYCLPAGAVQCRTAGQYCEAGTDCGLGNVCVGPSRGCPTGTTTIEGACVPVGHQYCGNRVSCAPPLQCGPGGTCVGGPPPTGPVCAGARTRCPAGNVCSDRGSCIDPQIWKECSPGKYCMHGQQCLEANICRNGATTPQRAAGLQRTRGTPAPGASASPTPDPARGAVDARACITAPQTVIGQYISYSFVNSCTFAVNFDYDDCSDDYSTGRSAVKCETKPYRAGPRSTSSKLQNYRLPPNPRNFR
jgi:hypothetical protein